MGFTANSVVFSTHRIIGHIHPADLCSLSTYYVPKSNSLVPPTPSFELFLLFLPVTYFSLT